MEEDIKQDNLEKLFGVTQESVDKSKDILPVLDLGKMDIGTKFKIEFIESVPREIETPDSPYGNDNAKVINVKEISLGESEEQGAVSYSMFLSSKSLALGVAKLFISNSKNLKGVKALITVSEANYKTYGKNRCYIVQQME